jgi:type IV secretion system protein VirB10
MVAAAKGKVVVVMGTVAVIVIFLLFSIFSGGDEEATDAPKEMEIVKDNANIDIPEDVIKPPPLPEPEPEEEQITPPPDIPPPTVPVPDALPVIAPEIDAATLEQLQARQRSDMMITDNGDGALGGEDAEEGGGGAIDGDPNRAFADAAANSRVERSFATRIGNLKQVIAQGRLIQATLETAINTDLPATIRAIVSRDVFGEAGTTALIPKGSRLIGTYSTSVTAGQSRVFVVWQRVIRPDGIDIQVGSPGVDAIGQSGLAGQVDTKFQDIFSRAVLASVVSIAFAIGADEINPSSDSSSGSSITTSVTGTTQSGDAASTATINALNRLGSVTEQFISQFVSVKPTILVDQGTPVNIILTRDLIFPSDVAGTRIIN